MKEDEAGELKGRGVEGGGIKGETINVKLPASISRGGYN